MGAGVQGALAVPRLVIKAKLEAVACGITF
jgi:hypothetical protein